MLPKNTPVHMPSKTKADEKHAWVERLYINEHFIFEVSCFVPKCFHIYDARKHMHLLEKGNMFGMKIGNDVLQKAQHLTSG